jgi:hypothetical protein
MDLLSVEPEINFGFNWKTTKGGVAFTVALSRIIAFTFRIHFSAIVRHKSATPLNV